LAPSKADILPRPRSAGSAESLQGDTLPYPLRESVPLLVSDPCTATLTCSTTAWISSTHWACGARRVRRGTRTIARPNRDRAICRRLWTAFTTIGPVALPAGLEAITRGSAGGLEFCQQVEQRLVQWAEDFREL